MLSYKLLINSGAFFILGDFVIAYTVTRERDVEEDPRIRISGRVNWGVIDVPLGIILVLERFELYLLTTETLVK